MPGNLRRACRSDASWSRGILLRGEHQFRRQQRLRLILRDVGTFDDVADELRPERQRQVAAIHILHTLAVGQEQVIAPRPPCHVDIFAQLDRSLGTDDEQPPVAPGRWPSGVCQSTRT